MTVVQEMLNDDLSVCTSIGLQEASAIKQDPLDPRAPEFVPDIAEDIVKFNKYREPESPDKRTPVATGMSEISKFIVMKDLLLSRLSKFDDQSERYHQLKNSYINVVNELDITAMENLIYLTDC